MPFHEMYRFEDLVNIAEDLVVRELEKQLGELWPGLGFAEEAVLDMAAYALNSVKPMYRANLMGRVYVPAFEALYHEEIVNAVSTAIQKIAGDTAKE